MRAYLVKAGEARRFAGTRAEASKLKKDLAEEQGLHFRAGDFEEVEVPTDKTGLLDFINNLLRRK